jgi:ligand-binding SRPBCC domain-containing protein
MKLYALRREQVVDRDIEEIFGFFSVPENLGRLTPPEYDFQILTPPPVVMRRGTMIDYVIRIGGIPMRWRSLITDYDPPGRFVDQQLRGPYDFWHHSHRFEPTDGGTRIVDEVRYALPFGPLGRLVHALLVGRQLRKLFDFRARIIRELFGIA